MKRERGHYGKISDRDLDITNRGGGERDLYMKDRGLIFSRDDQTDEVNKRFII